MTTMRRRLGAVLLGLGLGLAAPNAIAADKPREPDPRERAEELAREGMERILRALELMMQSIPQYELPEVDENGDIIIRRKRPKRQHPPAPEPEFDRTRI